MDILKKFLSIFLASVLLVSCISRDSGPPERSQFILTQDLLIQSGYSKFFFQANGPIRPADVNEYEPFCSLNTELTSTARTPIEIQADIFTIAKIRKHSPSGDVLTVSAGQREGVRFITTFTLESEKQAFVHSLNCLQWVVTSNKTYLSISDIEKIIGNTGRFIQ